MRTIGSILRRRCAAVVLLLTGWPLGCSQPPSTGVTVDAQRVHPPLLLRELEAAADTRALIDSAFRFQNNSADPQSLRFEGAGCSCYSVTCADRVLKKGDQLTIPAHGDLTIHIGIPSPTSAGEPQYNAEFAWLREDSVPVSFPLLLSIPVYSEITASPRVVTTGYRPDKPPLPFKLQVASCARDRQVVDRVPALRGVHAYLQPGEWQMLGVDQPAAGLWRSQWEVPIDIELPAGYREQLATSLQVDCGAGSTTQVSVLIQPHVGIRSPSEIQFGLLRPGERRRRRVQLAAADRVDFVVTSAICDDQRCLVTVDATNPAQRHWLEVEVVLPDDSPLNAEVLCQTDHPEAPQVMLRVAATGAGADVPPTSNTVPER